MDAEIDCKLQSNSHWPHERITPAMQSVLFDRTRSVLRDVSEPFTLLEKVSSSDTKNHDLMREVADAVRLIPFFALVSRRVQ